MLLSSENGVFCACIAIIRVPSQSVNPKGETLNTTNRNRPLYIRRFPEEMRSRIAQAAEKHDRSFSAEVLRRLRQSLADDFKRETAPPQ
jgi:hypothetical protein